MRNPRTPPRGGESCVREGCDPGSRTGRTWAGPPGAYRQNNRSPTGYRKTAPSGNGLTGVEEVMCVEYININRIVETGQGIHTWNLIRYVISHAFKLNYL